MEQVRVALTASDPLSYGGLVGFLEPSRHMSLLPAGERSDAQVFVLACERFTTDVVSILRRSATEDRMPVVLVVNDMSEDELLTAVAWRVVAILLRSTLDQDRLVDGVLIAANGGGIMPSCLVGKLVRQIERLQREAVAPNDLHVSGLTTREADVLRLVADGLDTNEIAERVHYSERTVKYVIRGVIRRLKLRNRSHAVAYALRAGVI